MLCIYFKNNTWCYSSSKYYYYYCCYSSSKYYYYYYCYSSSTHGICITTTRYGNEGHTHALHK